MVDSPEHYRWSSYRWHAWGNKNIYIRDHALYQQLGSTEKERQYAYRDLFKLQIPDQYIHKIESLRLHYSRDPIILEGLFTLLIIQLDMDGRSQFNI